MSAHPQGGPRKLKFPHWAMGGKPFLLIRQKVLSQRSQLSRSRSPCVELVDIVWTLASGGEAAAAATR